MPLRFSELRFRPQSQSIYHKRETDTYTDNNTNTKQLHLLEPAVDKSEGNEAAKEEDFFAQCDNDNVPSADFNAENNNISKVGDTPERHTGDTPALLELICSRLSPMPATCSSMFAFQLETKPTPSLINLESQLGGAPSVDLLNSVVTSSVPSSIGVRKIQPKKGGLGARKVGGGLGATKVKTNFADIEARANAANEMKTSSVQAAPVDKPQTAEEELETVASMRLAYQELSVQKTREEAKLKTMDPAKAKQMERLGMGFNLRGSDMAHSAIGDMATIQQTAAPKNKISSLENDNFFTDYSLYSSGGGGGGGTGGHSSEKRESSAVGSSKLDKFELDALGYETIEPIGGTHSNITSMFANNYDYDNPKASTKTSSGSGAKSTSTSSSSYATSKSKSTASNDPVIAQQKFGNSKGFGSDQYFASEQSSSDVGGSLNRFQGSRAISSSDYFNDGSSVGRGEGTFVFIDANSDL
ncbi:blast:ADP-ribosylation factor GTPase-activating protein 2 [Drosophila guanche]|uniref:Blast:ADP-ribosylation factor GTPase-activating protein 2 n=1 Tax=Drosophila guanche TaxID=7266 RepID=A0A3B0J491_DROGU|nr:blast:ADP-ribosylation factor GTPase-activating protein 2 [Drosophila guanche]